MENLIREYSHSGVLCVQVFEGTKVTYIIHLEKTGDAENARNSTKAF
jgi:hypothetical protein